ncbi:unnamed protein product [Closterium sp. NIES-53]
MGALLPPPPSHGQDLFSSYCLTEPGSGSDAAALKTTARQATGSTDYILNGSKVILEDVRVPAANLIGGRGSGFPIAMTGLDGGRVNIGACSVGGAQFCLEYAQQYATDRKQFGKRITAFQNTQFQLADMATAVEASRLMVRSAATAADAKAPWATTAAAMAKRFATDNCYQVANQALQMLGGYGFLQDYPVERYLRDLRVHTILEGTNEIMRLIIARRLLQP